MTALGHLRHLNHAKRVHHTVLAAVTVGVGAARLALISAMGVDGGVVMPAAQIVGLLRD